MNRIEELQEEIRIRNEEIRNIRKECCHPLSSLTKTHKADQGNYDPSQDCYWTEFDCGLCGEQWSEQGSK